MKILLINPNRELFPYPVIPLGLCYVASSLRESGFDVKFLDLAFSYRIKQDIEKTLKSFQPDAVGISVRNIDNGEFLSTVYYLSDVKNIIEICREISRAVIFIGGSAVNISPLLLFQELNPDFAIAGDGERTASQLLNRLKEGSDISDTSGLVYMKNGKIKFNLPERRYDYGFNILSKVYQWVSLKEYLKRGGIVPIQTKRGCHFNCIYCSYNRIEGTEFRLKPVPLVLDEIEEVIKNTGIRTFEFVDSVFNHPESDTIKLLEGIL